MVQNTGISKVGESVGGIRISKENELIRVKTKLLHLADSTDFRLPILLPTSHPMVNQIIDFIHKKHGHAGIQFVMSIL